MANTSSIEQQATIKEVIQTLVSVLEHKNEYFRGHSERVSANCILFGSYLAKPRDLINHLYLAGLLYDIGMVYIPMEIVNKCEKLTDEELKIVREHPVIAENILSKLRYLKNSLPIIRHHHENYDGSGYPDGLQGDRIPLGARILCILDGFDAMTSLRPHRAALGINDALEQIRTGAKTIYDPDLADEFIRFMTSKTNASTEKKNGLQTQSASNDSAPALNARKTETDPLQKAVTDIVLAFKRGFVEVPAFPVVINKIQNALRSPDKALEDVARLIELDQVVMLRLLSAARSAHYGGNTNLQTVTQALSRIGMKDSQNLITAIALKSMYEADAPQIKEVIDKCWVHSIAAAYVARALARRLRESDEEGLFLLGLTHDVGKVLLVNGVAKTLCKNEPEITVDTGRLLEKTQAVHASFGGALLKRWGFNNEYVAAVNHHETPDLSAGGSRINLILYLANMLTRRMGYSLYEDQPDALGNVMSHLKLDESALDPLLDQAKQEVQTAINA